MCNEISFFAFFIFCFIIDAPSCSVTLEGLVCVPEEGTEESKIGVVLSHPHPMLGGNMTNNVIGSLLKG